MTKTVKAIIHINGIIEEYRAGCITAKVVMQRITDACLKWRDE